MEKENGDYKKAPLIERMTLDLNDEQKANLVSWIRQRKYLLSQDREEWFHRQQKFLDNYDDYITYVRQGPWDGAANVHLPFTGIMVKSYHSRLYNMFTQEDVTQLFGREQTDDKLAGIYRKLFRWYIYDYINEHRGIKGVIDEVCMDVASIGWAVIMKSWMLKQRKVIDVVLNKPELVKEMVDLEGKMEGAEAGANKVDISPYKEVQKIVTKYEGTMLHTVPYENVLFPNFIPESNDLDYPPLVVVTSEMTSSDIHLKKEQGIFDPVEAEKAIARGRAQGLSTMQGLQAHEKKASKSGFNDTEWRTQENRHNIDYAFCSYDVDGDGIDEELVVTMTDAGDLLNVVYLDRVSRSGKRPLFKFDCFSKPRQSYSRGLPELLYPLQTEMDMNHNMRLNYLQLQTCPFGVYRSTSNLKNETITIAPGKFIPVDEVTDFRPIQYQANATVMQGEEALLWNYGQQLANVSSISHGIVPQNVGPLRSTSGVMSMLGEMEKEFRPIANRMALTFKDLMASLIEDLDVRMDAKIKLRILGPDEKDIQEMATAMTKKYDIPFEIAQHQALQFAQQMDLKIDVGSFINSEEMRRNNAYQIMTANENPGIAQQFGIVSPRNIYNARMKWLKTFSYINPEDYITEPQQPADVLTLGQELQFVMQGMVPPMSMTDNHEEKLNGLLAFAQTPEYAGAKKVGLASPIADMVMTRTIKKHEELARSLAPRGLPNPSGANGMDMTAVMAGRAQQQGGMSDRTTNRDNTAAEFTPTMGEGGRDSTETTVPE